MAEGNNNVYIVLQCIRDKENDLGLCEARGMTKELIEQKSKLSSSTVNRALAKLLNMGLIKEALKQVNKKAYYVTPEGVQRVKELYKKI
jgi:predicted transcriptional regulator